MDKKFYRVAIGNAKVFRIVSNAGQAIVVDIPLTGNDKSLAGIIVVESGKMNAMLYEMHQKGGKWSGGLYYLDDGKVTYQPLADGFLGCLWDCVGGLGGIAGCGGSCAACAEGGFWTCLACAACLGNAGCCIGECAKKEPWGTGFCVGMYLSCISGNGGACIIYQGCQGNCIF